MDNSLPLISMQVTSLKFKSKDEPYNKGIDSLLTALQEFFEINDNEPFIDFIKAYAILCVLMGHTFPYLKASGV